MSQRIVDRSAWSLEPGVTYLNHGAFGATPRVVQREREMWSARLQANPMDFFVRKMEDHLAEARQALGKFVGAHPDHLAFVDNATFAMNIVVQSFPLAAGDEVLATNHEYGSVMRMWRKRCQQVGASLVVQKLPDRLGDVAEFVDTLFQAATPRTKLLVISQVTSPTAVIFPMKEVCQRARKLGIPVCVDGPHAVAAVPLNLEQLGCDFFAASCHKWLSGPCGSGFLYVHPRMRSRIQPVVVSWGASLSGKPATWQDEFNWLGTRDPACFLATPAAIRFLEEVGLETFRQQSHDLAQYARQQITAVTGEQPMVPDDPAWYGTMLTLPLPESVPEPKDWLMHPLQSALWERYRIEVPFVNWHGRRWMRVSCHLYNTRDEIDFLAKSLQELLGRE